MSLSRVDIRQLAREQAVEEFDEGFRLSRRSADAAKFSRLVSTLIEQSGDDYVALPISDGHRGYEGVFIMPLDKPR